MRECDDCKARNPYCFNWDNLCCRVRFIRAKPAIRDKDGKNNRDWWYDIWRKSGQGHWADKVSRVADE